ncbi:hypothetical protein VMCG_08718 [Cytospora schulzeri]|uniref:Peptidase M24 domain-containing protein n=1 Tax=Cytospora schulzeri TaxID=448051 RepID=A0A423VQ99_9PEZI|nr:hypothetical protein VMCG_08718 [Valsa malicola]
MHYISSILTASLCLAATAVAAPQRTAEPDINGNPQAKLDLNARTQDMTAREHKWTMRSMRRTCNHHDTECEWFFYIDTDHHSRRPTECHFFVRGHRASRTDTQGHKCGHFTVSSGWSGQFGPGQGFTVLSVVDPVDNLIAWPGYTDKQLETCETISQREYAEDTVFWALKNFDQFSARRRTTQLFLANATGDSQSAYSWIDNTALVWSELRSILAEQQPRNIALNTHAELAFSGGLHAGERDAIEAALGNEWAELFVLEPMIAVEVVATMVDSRLEWYQKMMETAWAIIEEAFSNSIITPGQTTTLDLEWWMRERIQSLNYTTWFQPSVYILNEDDCSLCSNSTSHDQGMVRIFPGDKDHVIKYGDIIHTDFGVTAMGLNTDTQHLGYVLSPGEAVEDIPESVLEGMRKVNRLQDVTRGHMKVGLTGNEILKNIRAQMHKEGIEGKIYCHATGEFGHSAGTVIGMTNLQDEVPFLGDLPLLKNTYYSIELYAENYIPEKNMTVKFPMEEDVYWSEKTQTWEWVIAYHKVFRPILKFLIGLGIVRKFNSALNSLATNHWRISSSPPAKPWDWPNEIAVVTGGCGDIGVVLVRGLTDKGVKVAVLDIADPPPAIQSNPNAFYFKCDITSSQEVSETADVIRKTMGGEPSILVNNAGIARLNLLLDISETKLRQVIGVNLMALWFTAKEFLPAMIKADRGQIVTVASLASFIPLVTSIEYSATKAGVLAFHEGLTGEIKHVYKARGVKTSIIHPDFAATAMTQPFAGNVEKTQKMMTVEDVARPVLAQIFSGRGGQLVIPASKGFASTVRGWPNWMQEGLRDYLARGFLG